MHGPVLAALLTLAVGSHTDTTLTVSPNGTLELENYAGVIEVTTWAKNAVRIEASHGRRAELNIDRDRDGIRVDIESSFGAPTSADFKLTVPATMSLKLSGVYCDMDVKGTKGSVEMETVQGDITVTGGEGHIELQSVQGTVTVDGASGKISVSSVNEGVKLTNVRGDLSAESVNGTIQVLGSKVSSFDGTTVNGTIIFDSEFARDGRYDMSTHNGSIFVAVPANANLSIEASTYAGSFDTTFPVNDDREERRKKRTILRLGTGGAEMNLESFQGTVVLHRPGETPYASEMSRREREIEREKLREKMREKAKDKSGKNDYPWDDRHDSDEDDD